MDQAASLRRLAARKKTGPAQRRRTGAVGGPLRTMAVTSGKGGVGKTNVVVNLALMLTKLGQRVLIIDADLGLANVDVVWGLSPKYTVNDVIHGRQKIQDVVLTTPDGVQILPAASGVSELVGLTREEKLVLLQELESFDPQVDLVLIDTAAGISDMVMFFNTAAQDRIVVATGEPTSLTDAYALIKVLYSEHGQRRFKVLVNNVTNLQEAKSVYRKLSAVADKFLGGLSLDYLGFIPSDPLVNKSVIQQRPLIQTYPSSPAAMAFHELAVNLINSPADHSGEGIKFFWRRLVKLS